jgi:hypothetical protein
MVESSFLALLVSPVGATSLVEPSVLSTREAAIVMAAITVRANEEGAAAFAVSAYP